MNRWKQAFLTGTALILGAGFLSLFSSGQTAGEPVGTKQLRDGAVTWPKLGLSGGSTSGCYLGYSGSDLVCTVLNTGNATQLQGRTLAATAPTDGQYVGWNDSLSQWEPKTITTLAADKTLSNLSNVSTARTNLGLATVASSGSAADLTGTLSASSLPTSGVTAGSCGSATQSCVLTYDSTGRLTAASTATITGSGGGSGGNWALISSQSGSATSSVNPTPTANTLMPNTSIVSLAASSLPRFIYWQIKGVWTRTNSQRLHLRVTRDGTTTVIGDFSNSLSNTEYTGYNVITPDNLAHTVQLTFAAADDVSSTTFQSAIFKLWIL